MKDTELLEVLKILKESIYNFEKHKRALSEPIGEEFLIIGLSVKGSDNVSKVLNWIKEK